MSETFTKAEEGYLRRDPNMQARGRGRNTQTAVALHSLVQKRVALAKRVDRPFTGKRGEALDRLQARKEIQKIDNRLNEMKDEIMRGGQRQTYNGRPDWHIR